MNDNIWILNPLSKEAEYLSDQLALPVEIAQALVNRKIKDMDTAQRFLGDDLGDLHDPFLMRGMEIAAERIRAAISRKEKILIFGDYDVDGILSVVSLMKALESIGAEVDYFIPERLTKGYGIKEEYIDIVRERGASLVLSVDCGIRAVKFVERANESGIDVIITDHHLPGSSIPNALAVLNPVLDDSGYPDKKLAGIGVVFKLIQALLIQAGKEALIPHYLKLVAIATIADISELRGENRIFVKHGLKSLESTTNNGLKCLLGNCGLSGRRVTVGDVGFRIGPRINAAGRLGLTEMAVDLFLTSSSEKAREIAKKLDKLNEKRQKIEEKIFLQARERIKERFLDKRYKCFLLGCENWHRGVIGIVSSKLKDAFYRPIILFSLEGDKAYGSGRSIPDFSLIECLEANESHFNNYGGHTLAVGCELDREKMGDFKKAVNAYVNSRLTDEDLKRKIAVDAHLGFESINSRFIESLLSLSPFGVGNPKPVFLADQVEISMTQKLKRKHSKFVMHQNGRHFEALAWNHGEWADAYPKGKRVDIVFSLQFSEYLGEETISINLIDIKPS